MGVENIFAGGTIISNAKRIASGKIELELKTGKLTLIPLNQNSIRVQFSQPDSEPVEELIYTESVKAPKPQIKENDQQVSFTLDGISVMFDKQTEALTFKDRNGRVILQEKAGGRSMVNSTVQGEPTFVAEQKFISPVDEYIYGTGQFQDGILTFVD